MEGYQRPYDPRRPLICMDERPQQLLIDAHEPLPMEAGQPEREDDAYERNGVSDIFLFFPTYLLGCGSRRLEETVRQRL